MAIDESTFQHLAEEAFRAIGDAFDAVDPDVADCEVAGDVVTITLGSGGGGGSKCVVNTQRPARQIWLAANARAWHFSWDEASRRWVDRGRGEELYATLARVVKQTTGADVAFA